MNETISLGHAHRVTEREVPEGKPCFYLPIHVVWRADKPNKYRICLDAASKVKGVYLNGELLSGPDLLNSLSGVLWRWRRNRFPVKADVKGFFHQIYIDENDSASFRFLWFEDETMTSIVEYEHAVHVFGGGSSPTVSTFTLQTHAEEVNDLFESDIKAAVDDQFYVDDYADSFKSIGEARRMRIDLTEGLRLGGFELTKWESPYPEILLDDPNISQVSAPVETTGAMGGCC